MGPLLDCLRALGGSARPKEVSNWIARELRLPPEITEVTIKSGANRFHNQVQWARQYLVWEGLLDDSKRGIWALSPLGWKTRIDDDAARTIFLNRVRTSQSLRKQHTSSDALPVTRNRRYCTARRVARTGSSGRPQRLATLWLLS